jgi:hypothetical protein
MPFHNYNTDTSGNARRCSNAERLWHLRRSCPDEVTPNPEHPLKPKEPARYILVDDERELLYCSMPKTASTSMKTFLFKMHPNASKYTDDQIPWFVHSPKKYEEFGFRAFHDLTEEEQEYRLNNYFKYLFVRHPFDRIASTWREKFYEDNIYIPGVGKEIIEKHRKPDFHPENGSLYETVPQLSEFAEYVSTGVRWNTHWDRIENECAPCQIHYDYIVRVESINDDLVDILALIGTNLTLTEHHNLSKKKSGLKKLIPFHEFDDVSDKHIDTLKKLYADDFRRFGYDFTKDRELVCDIETPRGQCC